VLAGTRSSSTELARSTQRRDGLGSIAQKASAPRHSCRALVQHRVTLGPAQDARSRAHRTQPCHASPRTRPVASAPSRETACGSPRACRAQWRLSVSPGAPVHERLMHSCRSSVRPHRLHGGESTTQCGSRLLTPTCRSRAIESRKAERPCAPAGSSVRRANTHVGPVRRSVDCWRSSSARLRSRRGDIRSPSRSRMSSTMAAERRSRRASPRAARAQLRSGVRPHRLHGGESTTQCGSRLLALTCSPERSSPASASAPLRTGRAVTVRRANTHVGARSTFGRWLALILGTPALSSWRHSLAFSLADVEHNGG
jgi:hypothetical protein